MGKTKKTFFCHVDKSKIILMVKLTKNFPHVDFDKWFIFCLTGVVIGEKVKSGLSSSRLFTSCRNWVFSFLQAKPCHICLNKWHVSFCYCKLARSIFSLSWWSLRRNSRFHLPRHSFFINRRKVFFSFKPLDNGCRPKDYRSPLGWSKNFRFCIFHNGCFKILKAYCNKTKCVIYWYKYDRAWFAGTRKPNFCSL